MAGLRIYSTANSDIKPFLIAWGLKTLYGDCIQTTVTVLDSWFLVVPAADLTKIT
jgi:hypothetical protein